MLVAALLTLQHCLYTHTAIRRFSAYYTVIAAHWRRSEYQSNFIAHRPDPEIGNAPSDAMRSRSVIVPFSTTCSRQQCNETVSKLCSVEAMWKNTWFLCNKKCEFIGFDLVSPQSLGQSNVFAHNRHSLRVDCRQIGVLEQRHHIRLGRLLQRHNGRRLESQVVFEITGNLSHQSLERQFAHQQLRRFLISPDLPQRHGSWTESPDVLDASGGRRRFPGSFGRQLLPRCLSSRRFPRRLLGSGHLICWYSINSMSVAIQSVGVVVG